LLLSSENHTITNQYGVVIASAHFNIFWDFDVTTSSLISSLKNPKDCDRKNISKRSPHGQALSECLELEEDAEGIYDQARSSEQSCCSHPNHQTNAIAASRNAKIEHTINVLACDDPCRQ
jgi:hypothetical protein